MISIKLVADQIGSYSGELSFTNNDGDENPYNFTITGEVVDPEPEIDVYDEYELIEDGLGYVDVGQTITGTPLEYTFTVTIVGGADLTLDPASLELLVGFSLVSGFDSTVEPLDSTEFTVQLDATVTGNYNGEVSFSNDDSDEDPFNFTISGDIVDPSPLSLDLDADDSSGMAGADYYTEWNEAVAATGYDRIIQFEDYDSLVN